MSEQLAALPFMPVEIPPPPRLRSCGHTRKARPKTPTVVYLTEPRSLLPSGAGPLVLGVMSDADGQVKAWIE